MARAPAGTDCNQRQGLYLLRVREAVTSNRRLQTPQYPVTIRDKFEFITPLLQPPLGSDERLSWEVRENQMSQCCLLYTSPSPRDATLSRMPSSA